MPIELAANVSAASLPKTPPSASNAQTAQPGANANAANAASVNFQAAELIPSGPGSAGPLAEIATNALSQAHSKIENLARELPQSLKSSAPDQIDVAKRDMSPNEKSLQAGDAADGADGKDSIAALNTTFNHAVFMAMVNQVISGVGDTSRTLLKQT